ncbi:DUF4374 domain-containing protein [Sphingobacteriaceae bacterium WQ 2009]|uniref:DUF4374 domain-containing protein n=1 Tax=Rhinopithecimicrobium faecis TaxID=2820698 RepID=A0A8T4HBA1_9SPHI|nr:DUF4374 domain-containing protein [Sphingobacteriaceae bacterium WQ 2009]
MSIKLKKHIKVAALLACTAISISSCNKTDKPNDPAPIDDKDPKYAISYSTKNGSFMLPISDLMKGTISPIGTGTDVSSIFTWEENRIQKGKYFYHLDPNASKFGKYVLENGIVQIIKAIPLNTLSNLYLGWHSWLDEETLAFGPRSSNEYTIVNVKDMTIKASGKIDTGKDVPKDHQLNLYTFLPQGNKILIGYSLYNKLNKVTYDTTYTATLDYPTFNNFKITGKDLRSNPIGPLRNGYFHKFKENGYTYLLTYPMPVLGGNKPNMPTGFFRIKDGETKLDPEYFFNVSKLRNGDNQLGVEYLGNGKALLISANDATTNVKEFDDWWYAVMWEYLIVDINTQTIVKKLDFPLVSNSRSAIVDNGKVYIAVNDPKADAIYIWQYDPIKDQLTRGAKIVGGDNDTPMLFKLK